jgi:hypothetical protein
MRTDECESGRGWAVRCYLKSACGGHSDSIDRLALQVCCRNKVGGAGCSEAPALAMKSDGRLTLRPSHFASLLLTSICCVSTRAGAAFGCQLCVRSRDLVPRAPGLAIFEHVDRVRARDDASRFTVLGYALQFLFALPAFLTPVGS